MPILLLLIGLAFPRVVIFLLWIFTTWTSAVDWIIGALGFLLMPYTLLWYLVVLNVYGGVFGLWQLLILILAIAVDFYGHFSSWRSYSY